MSEEEEKTCAEPLKEYECACYSKKWAEEMVDHVYGDHTQHPDVVQEMVELYTEECKKLVGQPIDVAKAKLREYFGTKVKF